MVKIPNYLICDLCKKRIYSGKRKIIFPDKRDNNELNLKFARLMQSYIRHMKNCKKSTDQNKGKFILPRHKKGQRN